MAATNELLVRVLAPRYETLPPDATVEVAGAGATVESLARRHLPPIYDPPGARAGPLREVLFEARRAGPQTLAILYRTVWDDEVHPSPRVDGPYRLFRRWYFGTAVDVEYVLVEIDLATGEVAALDYQTEPSLRYDVETSAHARVREEPPRPPIELRVVTWNHMVARRTGAADEGPLVLARPTLRAATDEDRRQLCFARATYGYLEGFGPLPLGWDLTAFGVAIAAGIAAGWALGRPRRPAGA